MKIMKYLNDDIKSFSSILHSNLYSMDNLNGLLENHSVFSFSYNCDMGFYSNFIIPIFLFI